MEFAELISALLHLSAGGLTPVLLLAVYILWQRLVRVTDHLIQLRHDFDTHRLQSAKQRDEIIKRTPGSSY